MAPAPKIRKRLLVIPFMFPPLLSRHGWRAELKGRGGCWLRVFGLSRQQAINGRDYSTSVNREHVPQAGQAAAGSGYGLLDLKRPIAKSAAGWTAGGAIHQLSDTLRNLA
jgi:hypothetical protein